MSIDLSAQGDVTIGGDVVGRDKIINNIQNIVQRALTAAEEAEQDRALETKILAQGVSAFAQRLQARASEAADTGKGGPYKGLLEYRLSDAEIFFGRSKAIATVLGNLQRGPLTILHAESGAGKTSLLQAGVSPRLIAAGHLPVYLRPYNVEPSLALKRVFLPDLSATPLLATAPLHDFLRQADGLLGEQCNLYIFLDQFEEFFTHLEEPARAEFIRELAECLNDEALKAHWVLSMRTEFFGNLANFRPRIRNPFENDFRLNRLTRAEAHEVVVEPAKRRSVTYEPGLVETILDDLGTGADEVPPPQIQLVCSVLYEELPAGSTQITRALYEAQGGASGILRGHLDRVMQRDLPPEQAPIAQRVLEALISADGHRLIRSRNKLLVELNASGQPMTLTTLDAVLNQLVDSRLLRVHDVSSSAAQGYETTSGLSYELTHDYLLEQIKVDPAVQARKAAQELLEQETRNFERYGTLLSDDKLAILAPRQKELVLTEPAQKLLDRSEAALRRRRGILRVGAGLVILLIAFAVVSSSIAVIAQGDRVRAVSTQQFAETAAIGARILREVSEGRANLAATSQAAAQTQQATAEAIAATAEAVAATAQAEAIDAEARAADANAVVQSLFENNGLIPVGARPYTLAYDGQRVWVTNFEANTIQAIDGATGLVVAEYPVGLGPTAITFDAEHGALWVANSLSNTVQAVNPETGEIIGTVDVGREPSALVAAAGRVWVTNRSSDSVQAIDPASQTAHASIPVGSRPWALAWDGTRVWVANWNDSTIQSIDPAAETAGERIPVGGGGDTRPWSLFWDGKRLWMANDRARTVQAYDPANNAFSDPIAVGARPSGFAFDGRQLWIGNFGSDTVQVIDPEAGRLAATFHVGSLPRDLIFANGLVWVTNFGDNTVKAVNPILGDLSAPIPVNAGPRALAWDGSRLWVANSGSNTVQAIDPATSQIVDEWKVGAGPRGLVFDGTRLWVANGVSNTVQALDIAANVRSRPLDVGRNPRSLAWDGSRVWVVNGRDDNIQPVDPIGYTAGITVSVGHDPIAILFDDIRLWVTDAGDDNTVVSVAPTSGRQGDPIQVGKRPNALAFDGTWLWVANQDSNDIQPIDPNTNQPAGNPIKVGIAPVALAWDSLSKRLWVANFASNTVQFIDPTTGAKGVPIPVGSGPIALTFDGERLWIASLDANTVQYITIRKP